MNTLALVGTLTRSPTTRFEGDGLQMTTLTLAVPEPAKDGRTFTLYVPCVAYGRAADACSVLEAETLVALQGKLSWRKQQGKCGQDHSQLVVRCARCRSCNPPRWRHE